MTSALHSTLTLGLHPGDAVRSDRILDLGARHPSAHGMLRIKVTLSPDNIIKDAEPLIGSMHRGAEKLFEARDYRQLVMLTDRHDWLSAPSSELGAVLAIEYLLGLEPPARATWLRMLLAEINRVGVHALFLAEFPWLAIDPDTDAKFQDLKTELLAQRERLLQLTESLTGARIHVMWNQIGGVRSDIPDEQWTATALSVIQVIRDTAKAAHELITDAQHLDCGKLTKDIIDSHGVTGVIARAAGVKRDLRVDIPYLFYGQLADVLTVPTRTEGTARARLQLLCEEINQSAELIDAIKERLDEENSPIESPLPKVLRVPEGSVYRATENPLGTNGYWLVSAADKMPHRFKLRSASFNNVSALPHMLKGCSLDQALTVLATTFFITGDIDK